MNYNQDLKLSALRETHQPSDIFGGVHLNPALQMSFNCNVHIHYNLGLSPTTKCVCRHYGQSYPDSQNVVAGNRLVCDV